MITKDGRVRAPSPTLQKIGKIAARARICLCFRNLASPRNLSSQSYFGARALNLRSRPPCGNLSSLAHDLAAEIAPSRLRGSSQ